MRDNSGRDGQQRQPPAARPPAAAASATAGPADRLCCIPQCAPRLPRRRTEESRELGAPPMCTTGQAYQQQRRQRDQHEAGGCQVQVCSSSAGRLCSPLAPGHARGAFRAAAQCNQNTPQCRRHRDRRDQAAQHPVRAWAAKCGPSPAASHSPGTSALPAKLLTTAKPISRLLARHPPASSPQPLAAPGAAATRPAQASTVQTDTRRVVSRPSGRAAAVAAAAAVVAATAALHTMPFLCWPALPVPPSDSPATQAPCSVACDWCATPAAARRHAAL